MEARSGCGAWSVVSDDGAGTLIAVPLRCNSWDCPWCARKRKRVLFTRLEGSAPQTLLTLTCSTRANPDPEEAFRRLSDAVNKLFKRIRRRCAPAPVEYFLVWELTRAGHPHAHLLLRGPFISQRWLSAQWADLAGSPIVDIRAVSNAQAAASYVAKYLTKALSAPCRMKRWRSSRGYFLRPCGPRGARRTGVGVWSIEPASTEQIAERWRDYRLTVGGDPRWAVFARAPGWQAQPDASPSLTIADAPAHRPVPPQDQLFGF